MRLAFGIIVDKSTLLLKKIYRYRKADDAYLKLPRAVISTWRDMK